jgi:type I restriction-modification system DNA methylase subunit
MVKRIRASSLTRRGQELAKKRAATSGRRANDVAGNHNDSDWGGERQRSGERWEFGVPPTSNANFAWVQNFIHHLAPHGYAGFVLAKADQKMRAARRRPRRLAGTGFGAPTGI